MHLRVAALFLILSTLFICITGCGNDGNDPDTANNASSDAGEETDTSPQVRLWPPPREGCNGHPDLCEIPFHQVVFPATHNAMSNAADEWGAPNQNLPLRTQLIDGIRVFLLDTYEEEGELVLCHVYCALGSRPLLDAMQEFRSFFDENPDEVLTIIFEDHISREQTVEVLEEAGLTDLVYAHEPGEDWPTLGEMIADNTRLVVTNENASPPPDWMHQLWEFGWDTPYSFSSTDEFNCTHNRGVADTGDNLFLVNHWVLDPLPSTSTAEESNSYEVLMERVEECQTQWQRLPTFIAVDFYDIGDLFEVVDILNGLQPARD